ncbi:hypothetical protein CPC08DRAFT_717074 [Agrocybe pediades]|nr:hypothetical protein CPC08DRAFT_717074 [Agrocybe pediades]
MREPYFQQGQDHAPCERPILNNSVWADCQRTTHGIRTVGDMLTYVERVFPENHRNIRFCPCDLCRPARELGCRNPVKCTQAGIRMLDSLVEKWDPRRARAEPQNHEHLEEGQIPPNAKGEDSVWSAFRVLDATPPMADLILPRALPQTRPANRLRATLKCVSVTSRGEPSRYGGGIFLATGDVRNVSVQGKDNETKTALIKGLPKTLQSRKGDSPFGQSRP